MILTSILLFGSIGFAGKQVYQAMTVAGQAKRARGAEPSAALREAREAAVVKEQNQEELNQNLSVAGTALGMACAGELVYAPLALAGLPGFLFLSKHVFDDGYRAWRKKRTISVDALSFLVKVLLFGSGHFVLANLSTTAYAVNRRLLYSVKDNSRKNIIDVFRQHPRKVFVLHEGHEIEIPFETLEAGDIVVVHAGETIPVDGVIVAGDASVDQHLLTGEAQPVEKSLEDEVFALTVVQRGQLRVRVEKTGEDTTAAQIGQILNETVDVKTQLQLRAETLTNRTVVPTLVAAGASVPFIGPIGAAGFLYAHPKYKAVITGSVSILSSLNLAARRGILIKDGRTLDLLTQVDTVVFDKTGTLTLAQPHVGHIHTCHGFSSSEVLHYAVTAEYKQTHPVARAIQDAAAMSELAPAPIQAAHYNTGRGILVKIKEGTVRVGSMRFFTEAGLTLSAELRKIQAQCYAQGHSLVLVGLDNHVIGAIELHATVRHEIEEVIAGLRQRGVKSLYIISGDHAAPTAKLAADLGIDHYFAETLPEQKARLIEQLQREGKSVCYVGDGINDSIALKKATVSISLHGGSTVAIDTAQVVLMDESLKQLCATFDIAQQFQRNMKGAFVVVMVPHAAVLGGTLLFHTGFLSAFILANVGLLAGVGYAMLPLLRHGGEPSESLATAASQQERLPTLPPGRIETPEPIPVTLEKA